MVQFSLTCLPGRVAVLVPEEPVCGSSVLLPEAVRERRRQMERPPYRLMRGTVVAIGPPRGRVPMPSIGDTVWVLPKPGLIVSPGDLDIRSLGAQVPPGHTLRVYGVGDPWHESVLMAER